MLLLLLAPSAGAAGRPMADSHRSGHESMDMNENRGIVTDDDGFIGNGRSGADAHYPDTDMNGIMPRTNEDGAPDSGSDGDVADGDHTGDGILGGDSDNGLLDGNINGDTTGNGAVDGSDGTPNGSIENPTTGGTTGGTTNGAGTGSGGTGSTNNGATDKTDEQATGVMGWVIAILVIVGVVLVALAFMPKKNNSNKR